MSWILIGILGLIAGSFLNCLVWRICNNESFTPTPFFPLFRGSAGGTKESSTNSASFETIPHGKVWGFIRGRSKCPRCGRVLKWFELIPVLSFVIQKARCRSCQQKISWQYPIVEITMALLFLFTIYNFSRHSGIPTSSFLDNFGAAGQFSISNFQYLIFNIFIICVLAVIFLTDLNFGIISDWIVWPGALIIFFGQLLLGLSWWRLVLAMAISGSFFGLQYLVSRGRWIGAGDIGLGFLMGAILGWPGILVALMLAYMSGAIIGLALVALKKKTFKSAIPFGIFLIPATFVVMIWGRNIVNLIFSFWI